MCLFSRTGCYAAVDVFTTVMGDRLFTRRDPPDSCFGSVGGGGGLGKACFHDASVWIIPAAVVARTGVLDVYYGLFSFSALRSWRLCLEGRREREREKEGECSSTPLVETIIEVEF